MYNCILMLRTFVKAKQYYSACPRRNTIRLSVIYINVQKQIKFSFYLLYTNDLFEKEKNIFYKSKLIK